jgi:hypothetical protein
MMRKLAIFSLLMATSAQAPAQPAASPAAAKSAPRASTPSPRERLLARKYLNEFWRCVARFDRAAAEELLSRPLGSPGQGADAQKLSLQKGMCMTSSLGASLIYSFHEQTSLGPMAEYLISKRVDVADLAKLTPEILAGQGRAPRNPLEQFAQCAAGQDPLATRAVFDTEIGSKAENEALAKIGALLPACVDEGNKVAVNAGSLRELLAIGLLRLAGPPGPRPRPTS